MPIRFVACNRVAAQPNMRLHSPLFGLVFFGGAASVPLARGETAGSCRLAGLFVSRRFRCLRQRSCCCSFPIRTFPSWRRSVRLLVRSESVRDLLVFHLQLDLSLRQLIAKKHVEFTSGALSPADAADDPLDGGCFCVISRSSNSWLSRHGKFSPLMRSSRASSGEGCTWGRSGC